MYINVILKTAMKKIMYILLFVTTCGFAQDWKTNFEEAKTLAQTENKKIVLVFSGSDWCVPCMKLEHEIWNTKTFQAYSKDHYVLLKADFPRRKKNALSREQQEKNNALAETYNKNGYFPLVAVLDKYGNILGETGYKKTTPQDYINQLNSF